MENDPDKQQVLSWWFGEGSPAIQPVRWFSGSAEVDAEVAERFGALYERAARGDLDAWQADALGAVALMVVLDQFPRHLFRGSPKMFATDTRALEVALVALSHRELLEAPHLAAIAVCLMHPEDKAIVSRSVEILAELLRSPESRADRKHYKNMWHSARRHLRVLERFGRYPHRNDLLGRETSEEELAYLASETSRFARSVRAHGQSAERLKILVLHSFRQSGRRLESRLRKLIDAVGDAAELVFVDAPHTYTPDERERSMLEDDFGAVPDFAHQRCWWNADEEHKRYEGWEESVRALEAHLPADGIIGFSQGGAMAGLFAALRTDKLRFVICISGFPSRADAHKMLTVPGSIDLPSLHIFGEQDVLMNRERTLQLAGLFVEPQVVSHPGGHFFPELWPTDTIRAFLLQFLSHPPVRPALDASFTLSLTLEELRAKLPSGDDAILSLLREARAQRVPPQRTADLRALQPGDLSHRIWLAAYSARPDLALVALSEDDDWKALTRLAIRAVLDLGEPAAEGVIDAVARRFAAQITRDEASSAISPAAEAAPRTRSGTDEITGLGRRIATLLCEGAPPQAAYARSRRRIVALSRRTRASRRRVMRIKRSALPSPEISSEVTRPRPVPVVPCPEEELAPLIQFLSTRERVVVPTQFPRGTLMPDGRLDLCKQVVGPQGIGPLLRSLSEHEQVDRLLLGNNVVGSEGAREIAEFVRSKKSRVRVWYIAGNEFDADSIGTICAALREAPEVRGLWLKRNPIGPAGAAHLAALLREDPQIETLDLVNTGLLDEGTEQIMSALRDNTHLRHLYLGTDGLTQASGPILGRYLGEVDRLESLYADCNRLGDEGAIAIAEGLAKSKRLRRLSLASNRIGPDGAKAIADALRDHPSLVLLNLGWTRATNAVHEEGNRLGDEGCSALAEMLRHNKALRVLDVSHNAITQRGLDQLREGLSSNRTLVSLRHPQYGKATNPDSIAALRGAVERNRREAALDADAVEAIRTPLPTREILSVYRTAPMS